MAKKRKSSSNTREVQNAAKTMLANIRFASVDSIIQSIAITSAVPNEGKTTSAIELAKTIASSGDSVLLVEADMRRRSAATALGVHAANGAYAVMTNSISLEDAVIETGISNFYFLDVEPNIPNPADLLSSRAYKRLVNETCDKYDYVIFDTPPVGTFVDAAILSRLVDGVVLVVKIGGAKRDEILTAYDQLQKAEANIIGACATFCESTGSEYYYAYYNKDNERVDPEKEARKARKQNKSKEEAPAIPKGVPATDRGAAHRAPKSDSVRPVKAVAPSNASAGRSTKTNTGSISPSSSQSWKVSAVQAAARRSNTPRIDRSKEGRRH